MFMFSSPLLLLLLGLSVVSALVGITKDVFSKNSAVSPSSIWLEAGQMYLDDSHWTNVTTVVKTFVNPVILLSMPDFGGSTYNSGPPLSLTIRNKKFGSNGALSFQVKVSAFNKPQRKFRILIYFIICE